MQVSEATAESVNRRRARATPYIYISIYVCMYVYRSSGLALPAPDTVSGRRRVRRWRLGLRLRVEPEPLVCRAVTSDPGRSDARLSIEGEERGGGREEAMAHAGVGPRRASRVLCEWWCSQH